MPWYINDDLWIKKYCNAECKRYWLIIDVLFGIWLEMMQSIG